MSDKPALFRLRTFGPPALVDAADATVVGDSGQQRRRLALLAVLAAAGERGRTRDQLLLLFWPDSTQAKARHSLEQLVYAIRNSVHEQIFAGTNPLRLNPGVVRTDVGEFTESLGRGEPAAAVQLYTGPFLDGFYLGDAPEFEQWMHAERTRLARSYATALEQLARSADAAGDRPAALQWWQALSDADPLSNSTAMGLMRALALTGDHPAALRHAEQYERELRRELGTAPGPEVAQLVAEIRERAEAPPAALPAQQHVTPGPEPLAQYEAVQPLAEHEALQPLAEHDAVQPLAAPLPPERVLRPSRHLLIAAAALVGLVIVFATVVRRNAAATGPTAGEASHSASLAVLPLANVSGTAEDAAIVDGLTEELIGVLSRIDDLRVVARTSAFVFRDRELSARQIADSLGVSHLLEGGVQKAGDRLRVQVRLIDARDGSTRWSERYDRQLSDIFELQSDIALAVARELDVRLRPGASAALRLVPTRNVAAYELYLRGRDPVHFRTAEGPLTGLEYLRQAVALDSNFAAAYANMAYMYHVYGSRGSGVLGGGPAESEYAQLARATAAKALELDPSLSEAHAAVGVAHLSRGDLRAAEEAFKRAIALPGYSRAREHLAHLYQWTGRPAEALAENMRAAQDDPLSPTAIADLGRSLCMMDRADEGLAQLNRIAELQPPLQRRALYEFWCYAMKRDWPSALRAAERIRGQRSSAYRGFALARLGRSAEASALRDSLMAQGNPAPATQFNIAVVSAGLRDYDSALLWLERSFTSGGYSSEIMYPVFADLHAHRGFERVRQLQRGGSTH